MKELIKRFWREEDGMGTVEIVIIIGILVAVALLFRDGITKFVTNLMDKFFNSGNVDTSQSTYTPPTT